jgi:hypothetical protein
MRKLQSGLDVSRHVLHAPASIEVKTEPTLSLCDKVRVSRLEKQ